MQKDRHNDRVLCLVKDGQIGEMAQVEMVS